jgi:HEAT repeat protein
MMGTQEMTGRNVNTLLICLGSTDGIIRQESRDSLVALGKPAVSGLILALQNSKSAQIRWEAAKALVALRDPRSVLPLVEALEDPDSDVAWLAAEGLIALKKTAWPPLLEALITRGSKAVRLYEGAHHVFRNQKARGFNDLLAALEKALEFSADTKCAAVAAYDIHKRMKATARAPAKTVRVELLSQARDKSRERRSTGGI